MLWKENNTIYGNRELSLKGEVGNMCTSILVRYKEGAVLARNMDYEHPVDYNVLYLPAGYTYAADLYGNPLLSKYKMMGVCFHDHNPLKDGVNEHGLIGCTNTFRVFKPFAGEVNQKARTNISSLDYFNYCLGNYRDVEELVSDLKGIHISTRDADKQPVICPDFHYFFADCRGRSVVIEPKEQKLVAIENPYDVMTNSPPFHNHEKRLKKLIDTDRPEEFNGVKNLPGGYDPVSRFIKAYYLNRTYIEAKTRSEALESAYSVLESLKMPQGFVKLKGNPDHSYTRYLCAYDNKSALLTVRSHSNPTVYSLSFDQIERPGERHAISVPRSIDLKPLPTDA